MYFLSPAQQRATSGAASIGNLLLGVFVAGLLISVLVVYLTFNAYRMNTVREMAQEDARRISLLVFEHLYSVMRKGWTRDEIDDVIHHIQGRLPGYEVTVVRGEPVVRQFGDRAGHAAMRDHDEALQAVFQTGREQVRVSDGRLRYMLPVKMSAECTVCHVRAAVGEINGVIAINVPTAVLHAPIENIVYPVMKLALALIGALLLLTVVVLRYRVSKPITDLADHVVDVSRAEDYSQDLVAGEAWPREVRSLADNFNNLMEQVRTSHAQLRDMSARDPMTGLFNRRHFDAVLEQAADDAGHGCAPFAVLLIDLDRFKPINDRFGHAAGDAVLVAVARAIRDVLRETDMAARIGGDEFAVLALATDAASAQELAKRLRAAIGRVELRFGHEPVNAACSVGVACFPDDGGLAPDLLHAADTAMYAEKMTRGSGR